MTNLQLMKVKLLRLLYIYLLVLVWIALELGYTSSSNCVQFLDCQKKNEAKKDYNDSFGIFCNFVIYSQSIYFIKQTKYCQHFYELSQTNSKPIHNTPIMRFTMKIGIIMHTLLFVAMIRAKKEHYRLLSKHLDHLILCVMILDQNIFDLLSVQIL